MRTQKQSGKKATGQKRTAKIKDLKPRKNPKGGGKATLFVRKSGKDG